MLTVEEVRQYLEAEQAQIEEYVKKGKLRAYKVGGIYLRFRKDEVLTLRDEVTAKNKNPLKKPSIWSRIYDFWKFNNFYILSILAVAALIYWFVQEYSTVPS